MERTQAEIIKKMLDFIKKEFGTEARFEIQPNSVSATDGSEIVTDYEVELCFRVSKNAND